MLHISEYEEVIRMELDIFTLVGLILFAIFMIAYLVILVGEWIVDIKKEFREKDNCEDDEDE